MNPQIFRENKRRLNTGVDAKSNTRPSLLGLLGRLACVGGGNAEIERLKELYFLGKGAKMKKRRTPHADAWREFLLFCQKQESSQQVYRGVGKADYTLKPSVGRSSKYTEQKEKNIFRLFEIRAQLYQPLHTLSALDRLVLAHIMDCPRAYWIGRQVLLLRRFLQ
jgi:hypothetical protein